MASNLALSLYAVQIALVHISTHNTIETSLIRRLLDDCLYCYRLSYPVTDLDHYGFV